MSFGSLTHGGNLQHQKAQYIDIGTAAHISSWCRRYQVRWLLAKRANTCRLHRYEHHGNTQRSCVCDIYQCMAAHQSAKLSLRYRPAASREREIDIWVGDINTSPNSSSLSCGHLGPRAYQHTHVCQLLRSTSKLTVQHIDEICMIVREACQIRCCLAHVREREL
jgi:hypothetical protein